jgi:hypothetical protein
MDSAANDTSRDVDQMQVEIYRAMSPSRKWELLDGLYRLARQLHAAGVRMRNPRATEDEILSEWFRATLDEALFNEVQQYRHERAQRAV